MKSVEVGLDEMMFFYSDRRRFILFIMRFLFIFLVHFIYTLNCTKHTSYRFLGNSLIKENNQKYNRPKISSL